MTVPITHTQQYDDASLTNKVIERFNMVTQHHIVSRAGLFQHLSTAGF